MGRLKLSIPAWQLSGRQNPKNRARCGTFRAFHTFRQFSSRARLRAHARATAKKRVSEILSTSFYVFSHGKYGKYGRKRVVERQNDFPGYGKFFGYPEGTAA